MKKNIYILTLFFLVSCGPGSLEDYQREGEALTRRLTQILEQIQSREDIAKAIPLLEKHFEKLVDLMIDARSYQAKHPEDASLYDSFASDELRDQLQRIYSLEGGRDAIEKAEHEALVRLDAFEKNLAKHQQQLPRK